MELRFIMLCNGNKSLNQTIIINGVNRIEAKHDINNTASGKVMKKCGMQFEGIHRQKGKNKRTL